MVRSLGFLCGLIALTTPVAAEIGALRTFNDWLVACDNVRFCRAMGVSPTGSVEGPALIVAREGQGAALPKLLLLWPDSPPGQTMILTADGETLGSLDPARDVEQTEDHGGGQMIKSEAVAQKIFAALRKAKTITIAVEGSKEEPHAVSLAGASAALLFIDDRQKRVGTRTALVRAGDRDPSTVPAPPALPKPPSAPKVPKKAFAEEAPPAVVKLYLSEAEKACDRDAKEAKEASAYLAGRLSPTQVLYAMQCWRAAYNFGAAFYVFKEGPGGGTATRAAFPAAFERATQGDVWPTHVLSNAEFDTDALEVTTFHKGRGIGDCGTAYSWRWTGTKFVPTAAKSMPICRGFIEENWLQLYRVAGQNKPLAE
ncbi:MAG TPA: DUF1176 domain-containing protein [Beijerinckiaceae bacterium]|nr:DUF1176 domain-containing protein [Beijerinckiaceae bacterium]